MKSPKTSKSFSLIEILVSLVVIGIVATGLPMILQTTVVSVKNTAREEIFYQEYSLLQLINTMYFDENNTNDDNYYKELNATQGDDELFINKYSNNEYNRLGKHQMDNNEFRSGSNSTVSHIGVDAGEVEGNDSTYDDVDDYNDYNTTVTTNLGNLVLRVKVAYIPDDTNYSSDYINFNFSNTGVNHNSNIKLITVYVQEGDNEINLSYPSTNIGASKYLSLDEVTK